MKGSKPALVDSMYTISKRGMAINRESSIVASCGRATVHLSSLNMSSRLYRAPPHGRLYRAPLTGVFSHMYQSITSPPPIPTHQRWRQQRGGGMGHWSSEKYSTDCEDDEPGEEVDQLTLNNEEEEDDNDDDDEEDEEEGHQQAVMVAEERRRWR